MIENVMIPILGAIFLFWLIGRFGAKYLLTLPLLFSADRIRRYIDLTSGRGPASPEGEELVGYQTALLDRYTRIYGPWWMTLTPGCRCISCTSTLWASRLGLHGWWRLCHMGTFRKGFDRGMEQMLADRWRVQ